MAHRHRDRPATGDQQHRARVVGSDVVECTSDTRQKFGVGRHAHRLRLPLHPRQQPIAQQAKVVAVQLWGVGFGQRLRVDGGNHRFAVVFVQAAP
jgi:hypothetical protein